VIQQTQKQFNQAKRTVTVAEWVKKSQPIKSLSNKKLIEAIRLVF
jgi:hypothetical protein